MPSKVIYPQYPRLHADRALVARVFITPGRVELDLEAEVRDFREAMTLWNEKSDEELAREKESLAMTINELESRRGSAQRMCSPE